MTNEMDLKTIIELAKMKTENPEQYEQIISVMKDIVKEMMKIARESI